MGANVPLSPPCGADRGNSAARAAVARRHPSTLEPWRRTLLPSSASASRPRRRPRSQRSEPQRPRTLSLCGLDRPRVVDRGARCHDVHPRRQSRDRRLRRFHRARRGGRRRRSGVRQHRRWHHLHRHLGHRVLHRRAATAPRRRQRAHPHADQQMEVRHPEAQLLHLADPTADPGHLAHPLLRGCSVGPLGRWATSCRLAEARPRPTPPNDPERCSTTSPATTASSRKSRRSSTS